MKALIITDNMLISIFLLLMTAFPGAFSAPAPNADPAPNERGVSVNKKRSNFWFAGVNESGAEFGSGNIPGTLGTDYTWPVTSTIDVNCGAHVIEACILMILSRH